MLWEKNSHRMTNVFFIQLYDGRRLEARWRLQGSLNDLHILMSNSNVIYLSIQILCGLSVIFNLFYFSVNFFPSSAFLTSFEISWHSPIWEMLVFQVKIGTPLLTQLEKKGVCEKFLELWFHVSWKTGSYPLARLHVMINCKLYLRI